MEIAIFSAKKYDIEIFQKYKPSECKVHFFVSDVSGSLIDSLCHKHALDAICVFSSDVVDEHVLSACRNGGVKAVLVRCAGVNNINLKYAKKCGIQVCRVPSYTPYSIAEHAVSLLLTLNRRLHLAFNRVSMGNFSIDGLVGNDINGMTVGVIGTGTIGRVFANIMVGFGATVICYDEKPDSSWASKHQRVSYASLDDIYTRSDVISLHISLTRATYHMINKRTIKKMKKGVILLNTGRGALVSTKDVLTGLQNKQISGCGLDVYEDEDDVLFTDKTLESNVTKDRTLCALRALNNVIITGHQAFLTNEALSCIAKVTYHNLIQVSKGITGEQLDNHVSAIISS